MRLSIVTTMFRSAPYIPEFYERASKAAKKLTDDYELVFVNDGSPDDSLAMAVALSIEDSKVRVVDLSRNFGHHPAMWAGLQHARGKWVFLIDCDLEESPEWLGLFTARQKVSGADVIYGVQESRTGSLVDRWGGWAYYKLFHALSGEHVPKNLMTVRLMSRRYLDALLQHTEVTFTMSGLWARTGFAQLPVRLQRKRKATSTYTFRRRACMFVDGLTAFSDKPLEIIFYLGIALVTFSVLVAGGLTVWRLTGHLLEGWTSLMVSIWLIGGLIIFCQGVIGVYLARVYREAKRRPITLVRHLYQTEEGATREPLRLVE